MSDWKTLLGQIAPTLATALGGPLAGAATSYLSNKLLGKPDGTQDDLAAIIQGATPEQLLAIKQADNEFKSKMAELGVKVQELDAGDRASARELASARGIVPQVSISLLFLGGYFGLMVAIIGGWAHIPTEYHDLSVTLIGVLTAGVPQVLNFWLGSSHGSQKKDAAIAKVAMSP